MNCVGSFSIVSEVFSVSRVVTVVFRHFVKGLVGLERFLEVRFRGESY